MSCTTRIIPATGNVAGIDPRNFARGLGIGLRHLAEYANVAPETPALKPLDARLQRYMRDARAVLDCATRLGGGRAAARDWFRHMPLTVFAYRTAEEMVSEGRVGELLCGTSPASSAGTRAQRCPRAMPTLRSPFPRKQGATTIRPWLERICAYSQCLRASLQLACDAA
ncbi:MAG: hypothetical protein ACYC97_07370 [Metallibacterium sp.]